MRIARAPGRVTLVGDHTDYNLGLSLPMAIDLEVEATFIPAPGSFSIGLVSDRVSERQEVALGPGGTVTAPTSLAGALAATARPRHGGTLAVVATLPLGAGLASSAAFSVAVLLALGYEPPDPLALATACQHAEDAAGVQVGLLDPLAIATARDGCAVAIDFANLDTRPVPLPAHAAFVVVHSGATRRLGDSRYAERRAECERAAQRIGRPLGQCEPGDLDAVDDPVLRRRARHVISECARVRSMETFVRRGDLLGAGAVMAESQRSLSEDFRASTPAIDQLVVDLMAIDGVRGARMSGGGFGGCVLALCEPDSPALDPDRHGPRHAWVVRPSGGPHVWSVP